MAEKIMKMEQLLLEILTQNLPNNIDAIKIFLDRQTGKSKLCMLFGTTKRVSIAEWHGRRQTKH